VKSEMPLIGAMFVLVILVLLGMVSFGVLALTSSAADLRYAEAAAVWVKNYYVLEAEANTRLMEADRILRGETEGETVTLLRAAGWEVRGDIASKNVNLDNDTGQNLNIEFIISPSEGRKQYILTGWQQWSDRFEYETSGTLVWPGN